MGENMFAGETKLYIGEQEVKGVQECVKLDYEIPIQEPLQVFDKGSDDGDRTSISVWKNGSIEMTFTITNEDNSVGKLYWGMVRRFRREKKALLWALTHGLTLRIPCCDDDDNVSYYDLTKPKELRMIMRTVKFIPQYHIYDNKGERCEVRRGKVVRKTIV